MLELLEELSAKERKVLQRHVHMHELTSLCLNGLKGQALVLTNHYLYLIHTGFFRSSCHKISSDQLLKAESREDTLRISTAENSFTLKVPPKKISLLPLAVERIYSWQSGASAARNP
jgi:hypothetical protein